MVAGISAAAQKRTATGVGFLAVALWALLAFLADAAGPVPPFLLNALCFAIAALVGGAWAAVMGGGARQALGAAFGQPPHVWLVGVGGIFGYHFLYFSAIQNAPAVEASLIAYLWPLLIVVFSALLPGERLRAHHLGGAALGFLGAALLVTGGAGLALREEYLFGYLMAGLCALTWSSYSVLSRRLAATPTESVVGFCAAAALLSALCHLAWEDTVWPAGALAWAAVLGLGLGPVGLAFFVWDHGVKRGDIQVLGAASYAAPVLSTAVLILAGRAEPTLAALGACLLITLGAAVAARDLFRDLFRDLLADMFWPKPRSK